MRKALILSLSILIMIVITSCKKGVVTDLTDLDSIQCYDEIYEKLVEEISNYNFFAVFKNVDKGDIIKAYNAVVDEHPEFFWINTGYSYEILDDGTDITITFKFNCDEDKEDIISKKRKLDNTISTIVSKTKSLSGDFEKLLYIHDYIIDNTDYDFDTYRRINDGNNYDATNAYGCLCNGKAVCSGYSAAMQLLLTKVGIISGRVSGTKIGGGSHEWNYVKLDDEYYYLDVTWDDPQSENQSIKEKTYEFFCVTTDEILRNHTINSDQFLPNCCAKKYDYYVYNNQYLEKYSFEEYKKIYQNSKSVKFGSEEEANKAVTDLIDNDRIFEIVGSKKITYSTGVTGVVLTVN